MAEQTLYRASSKLLNKAKKVFGEDVVTEAYVTTYNYGTDIVDAVKRLDKEHRAAECGKGFEIDGLHGVVLKFAGGNHVFMSTSEWGTIEKADIRKMVGA